MTTSKEQEQASQMSERSAVAMAAMRRASIVARRRALENSGGVFIWRDGEMVWETEPELIFPPGVEVKICECGRVLVKDLVEDKDSYNLDPLEKSAFL